jgi:hypothetical protein
VIDLRCFAKYRNVLGDDELVRLLSTQLSTDDLNTVLSLLDQLK